MPTPKLTCIMLVDDNPDDNFFHKRVITKNNFADIVIVKESALKALDYLKDNNKNPIEHPQLIFLDVNMPGMNGWEFLEEYNQLDDDSKSKVIIVMLTTSENPSELEKARSFGLDDTFLSKPLTKEKMETILQKYF